MTMTEDFLLFDPDRPNLARFDGPDCDAIDQARLTGQIERVWRVMSDHQWRTVNQICRSTGDPAPSVLAQLGHLRKAKFGAFLVERRRATDTGLYEYRVGEKGEGTPQHKRCLGCESRDAEIERLQRIIASRV